MKLRVPPLHTWVSLLCGLLCAYSAYTSATHREIAWSGALGAFAVFNLLTFAANVAAFFGKKLK